MAEEKIRISGEGMMPPGLSRWIEIDLDAVAANLAAVRGKIGPDVKIMAVVKADAYGLGAVAVSRCLAEAGAEMLAVTTLEEGLELRKQGITLPILVFAPLLPGQAKQFLAASLTPTVDRAESLTELDAAAAAAGKIHPFHLKVETGMGRNGILLADLPTFLAALSKTAHLRLEGIYSHLATAMQSDLSQARHQLELFQEHLAVVRAAGFSPLAHLANSAATLRLSECHLDMVRVGTLLYGQHPAPLFQSLISLQDPWRVKARVAAVKTLPAGSGIGYGRDFVAKGPLRIAVVLLGFADGLGLDMQVRPVTLRELLKTVARQLKKLIRRSTGQTVVWQGKTLPVLGRIAMQQCMVAVGEAPVQVGDEVSVSLRRLAASSRLPRLYFRAGKPVAWRPAGDILTDMAE